MVKGQTSNQSTKEASKPTKEASKGHPVESNTQRQNRYGQIYIYIYATGDITIDKVIPFERERQWNIRGTARDRQEKEWSMRCTLTEHEQ